MREYLAALILVTTLSACGTEASDVRSSTSAAVRIERCVDRLLRDRPTQATDEEAVRRYARRSYCAPFEEQGWVYDDGAVSIAAQTWLDESATCVRASEGEPAETVPCSSERARGNVVELDCALLHIVRRSEVREYIRELDASGAAKCDDGTAIEELGVP